MYTLYKINSDELNDNFITAIKALFPHQTIEIAISQTTEIEQNETAYHCRLQQRLLRLAKNESTT